MIVRPHRNVQHNTRPIASNVAWSVCVCLLVTAVSPAKTDEPIEMLLALLTLDAIPSPYPRLPFLFIPFPFLPLFPPLPCLPQLQLEGLGSARAST